MFENFNEEERQRYEDWQVSKFSIARMKKVRLLSLFNLVFHLDC